MTWWQFCILFLAVDRAVVLCFWFLWGAWHVYRAFMTSLPSPEPATLARVTPTAAGIRWATNGPTKLS